MVEKLIDKLKEFPPKFMAWWNKFSSKQKTAMIAALLGFIVAFAILITVVSRPQYVPLVTCENATQSATVKSLLDEGDYDYKVTDAQGLVYEINKDQLSDANILINSNNILTETFKLTDVVSGSLTTTEADKEKLYTAYLQGELTAMLEDVEFIEEATVTLHIPKDDGTLIANQEESFAQILLKLNATCSSDQASAIANAVKTAIGNETTEHIVIWDTQGNLLFSGGDTASSIGNASNQLSLKQQVEAIIRNEVRKVLLGTNEFDLIEVASSLTVNFAETERTEIEYTPADGQMQGVLSHESSYEAETDGGTAMVPGTDSNGDDTYVWSQGEGGSSSVSQFEKDYLPNSETTVEKIPAGSIIYDESSIAVTAISYKVIKEEDAKKLGLLDGISWDEYKLANSDRKKLEVDPELYSVVSNASGIALEDITIVAYEEPFFVDRESALSGIEFTDVLQIILIIIILLLLAYVVIRSFKRDKAEEEQPEELSVENLLQSMPAEPLEDIELETKSETRKMIEKFVEENPEAVANLLRNWLNEDWG